MTPCFRGLYSSSSVAKLGALQASISEYRLLTSLSLPSSGKSPLLSQSDINGTVVTTSTNSVTVGARILAMPLLEGKVNGLNIEVG